MSFVGTYDDPLYGGDINICSSVVGADTWGQGLASRVQYMRGKIVGNSWTGDFYTAGTELKSGTFDLVLTGTSLTGTYMEKPGNNITYTVSTFQKSTATPDALDCFAVDDYLLADSPPAFSFTGTYDAGFTEILYQDNSTGTPTLSDTYSYNDVGRDCVDADEACYLGFTYHNDGPLNGQISSGNWYEIGFEGIEIFGAKNSTHAYISWWGAPRMADFDYGMVGSDIDHGFSLAKMTSTATEADATANICYKLLDEDQINDCMDSSSSCNKDDFSDAAIGGITAGIFMAMIVGFVLGKVFGSPKKASMASKDSELGHNQLQDVAVYETVID